MIAELCQNHNGDVGIIKEMVAAAAEAGADYAKIQTIHSSQLTHRKRFDEGLIEGGKIKTIKRPYDQELARLKTLDIDDKAVDIFLEACRDNKIKPMTTIFTRDIIKKTFDQGFKSIKLASFDCISYPLAKEIIHFRPDLLIVSTGCSYKNEIKEMAEIIKTVPNHALLHCVSIYPTPLNEANISRIDYLKTLVKKVGLSDHSEYSENKLKILKWCVCKNIDFVERHFTILGKDETKDGRVSLNPSELKEAIEICHWGNKKKEEFINSNKSDKELIEGDPNRELSEVELLNRDYYQGRFGSKDRTNETVYNWDISYSTDNLVIK
tara:strand:- start:427 stop:1398 length:972 start_codon:yes stop_codon:yes gene_type:complete